MRSMKVWDGASVAQNYRLPVVQLANDSGRRNNFNLTRDRKAVEQSKKEDEIDERRALWDLKIFEFQQSVVIALRMMRI